MLISKEELRKLYPDVQGVPITCEEYKKVYPNEPDVVDADLKYEDVVEIAKSWGVK